MTVEHRIGDLFDQADAAALGHGVNLHGVMGSGIAPQFKRRWPGMYLAYKTKCRDRTLRLGGVFPWTAPDGLVIYNMATQDRPGPNGDLSAIRSALGMALAHAEQTGVPSLAIPRIGSGIARLPQADVARVIDQVAGPSRVRLIVVTQPPTA